MRTFALSAALLIGGCGTEASRAGIPQDHPASPQAPAAAPAPGPASQAPPSTAPQGLYACPMHPEVVSDKPGRCPKCGMALVRREPQ